MNFHESTRLGSSGFATAGPPLAKLMSLSQFMAVGTLWSNWGPASALCCISLTLAFFEIKIEQKENARGRHRVECVSIEEAERIPKAT